MQDKLHLQTPGYRPLYSAETRSIDKIDCDIRLLGSLTPGIVLEPSELMLVLLASTVATSVSPTPGGLGAAEVSMLLALERLSVASSPALAGVIAFRLITYWLPILPGYIFFRLVGSRRII